MSEPNTPDDWCNVPGRFAGPYDLCGAFTVAVLDRVLWGDADPRLVLTDVADSTTVELRDDHLPVGALCDGLWDCTEIMPSDVCDDLGLERGSSYAVGARHVSSLIA